MIRVLSNTLLVTLPNEIDLISNLSDKSSFSIFLNLYLLEFISGIVFVNALIISIPKFLFKLFFLLRCYCCWYIFIKTFQTSILLFKIFTYPYLRTNIPMIIMITSPTLDRSSGKLTSRTFLLSIQYQPLYHLSNPQILILTFSRILIPSQTRRMEPVLHSPRFHRDKRPDHVDIIVSLTKRTLLLLLRLISVLKKLKIVFFFFVIWLWFHLVHSE